MPQPKDILPKEALSPFGFGSPPDLHIECEAFTGSLGMLFLMVKDRKIDLLDVPLAPICEAYFRYLLQNHREDLERSAAALAALAYLLERKAWALIPAPEEAEPEGDDLLEEVEPYVQDFHPAIVELLGRREIREKLFFRTPGQGELPYELPFDTSDVTAGDLARAFERLMERAKPDPVTPMSKPRRSLTEMMVLVMKELPADFASLDVIVVGDFTRSEVVWWFLALLELIRLGQAEVSVSETDVFFRRAGHETD
ncbi:MAG: segregation/condensation protein A [Fimbriimonadaceae bacterium]|nr:segregation/condensation protein A [Fimbriimonadaceae bacterium]